jgi:hypothetical protein
MLGFAGCKTLKYSLRITLHDDTENVENPE